MFPNDPLDDEEKAALWEVIKGRTIADAAQILDRKFSLTYRQAKRRRDSAFNKLGTDKETVAVVKAIAGGIVPVEEVASYYMIPLPQSSRETMDATKLRISPVLRLAGYPIPVIADSQKSDLHEVYSDLITSNGSHDYWNERFSLFWDGRFYELCSELLVAEDFIYRNKHRLSASQLASWWVPIRGLLACVFTHTMPPDIWMKHPDLGRKLEAEIGDYLARSAPEPYVFYTLSALSTLKRLGGMQEGAMALSLMLESLAGQQNAANSLDPADPFNVPILSEAMITAWYLECRFPNFVTKGSRYQDILDMCRSAASTVGSREADRFELCLEEFCTRIKLQKYEGYCSSSDEKLSDLENELKTIQGKVVKVGGADTIGLNALVTEALVLEASHGIHKETRVIRNKALIRTSMYHDFEQRHRLQDNRKPGKTN